MNRPLFSITTPCFNSVNTIERTIKSILSQEFKDYEYIIVDGGSTDGTLDIIKRYEPLFGGRMHWKSEPDKGLYDALNKGIENSNGIYCWNINSDDFMEPSALTNLSRIIGKLDKNNYPIIVGAMNVLDNDGLFLYCAKTTLEMIKGAYMKNHMIPHPSTIVPKAVYELYGSYDIRFCICADKEWFHRTYASGVPMLAEPDIVLSNFVRGGISTNSEFKQNAKDHRMFFARKYQNIFKRNLYYLLWIINYWKNI